MKIREKPLEPLWIEKSDSLSAAVSAYSIIYFSSGDKDREEASKDISSINTILGNLKKMDPIGLDLGISYSLSSSVILKYNLVEQKIQSLLQSLGINITPKEKSTNNNRNHKEDNNQLFDNLIPTTVALEHPDPQQRLDAIDRLLSTKPDTIDGQGKGVQDGITFVLEGLLRRYERDNDLQVVNKAANAIVELMDNSLYLDSISRNAKFLEQLSHGFYRRSIFAHQYRQLRPDSLSRPTVETKFTSPAIDALLISFKMSASIVRNHLLELGILSGDRSMMDDHQTPALPSLYSVIQIIFSHLLLQCIVLVNDVDVSGCIHDAAASALMTILGCSSENKVILETALTFLIPSQLMNRLLENLLLDNLLPSTSVEQLDNVRIVQRAFISTLTRICSTRKTSILQTSSLELLIRAVVKVLESYNDSNVHILVSSDEALRYVQFLSSCAKVLIAQRKSSTLAETVAQISAIENNRTYELIANVVLDEIYKELNASVSGGSFVILALEVASRPNTTSISVIRLLKLVKTFMAPSLATAEDDRLAVSIITFILSLMGHKELHVRQALFDLIVEVKTTISTKREIGKTVGALFNLAATSDMRTQFLMDGASTIQIFLRSALSSAQDVHAVRSVIIRGCHLIISSFLDFSLTSKAVLNHGACVASTAIIETLHRMGEAYFPLSIIWTEAARRIFSNFLQIERDARLPSYSKILLDIILVLLKGVTVRSESEVGGLVITTIPTGSSHRSRSYSLTGASDDLSLIDQYPVDMTKMICNCLNMVETLNRDVCERLCEVVLSSVSWATLIFPKLDRSKKMKISLGLLHLKAHHHMEKAGYALLNFPLHCRDLCTLLQSTSLKNSITTNDLISVTFVAECIHSKSSSIADEQEILTLVINLFEYLEFLSRRSELPQSLDGLDYTRSMILQALISTIEAIGLSKGDNSNGRCKATSDLSRYNTVLTGMVGIDSDEHVIPMITGRGKALALKVLALVCSAAPRSIISTLVPTLIYRLKDLHLRMGSFRDSSFYESDILSVVIPAYYQNACLDGLTFIDLIRTVTKNCSNEGGVSWHLIFHLFRKFLDVLLSPDETKNGELLASIISSLVSLRVFYHDQVAMKDGSGDSDALIAMNEIMNRCSNKCRLASFIFIFRCAGELLSYRANMSISSSGSSARTVSSIELYELAWNGPLIEKMPQFNNMDVKPVVIVRLVETLMDVVRENMLLMNWTNLIKSNDGPEAEVSLKLWQEIVTLQSQCARLKGISSVMESISDCLSCCQNQLPIPHFLASVVSIVNDDKADQSLRKKVIQMLADRSTEIDPNSSEATLFIETITDLVDLLHDDDTQGDNTSKTFRDVHLKQAGLVCIEQIARYCECGIKLDERVLDKRLSVFTEALRHVTILMKTTVATTESISNLQILSSAALCASTLISLVKTRCLSFLPLLMDPLISSLIAANKRLMTGVTQEIAGESSEGIQLLQISILRAIQSIGENLPQSIGSYLDSLLAPGCLSSVALRHLSTEMSNALIRETLINVDNTLTKNIPPRQLVPSLTKVISFCLKSQPTGERLWREGLSNIRLLTLVMSSSSRADLVPVSGKIVQVLVQAYELDDTDDNRNDILSTSNEAMLALIMKLSESQMRPLYVKLREWRGDFDSDVEKCSCLRRQAFWKLSAVLCIELRSIFLPYMSSVLADAINELVRSKRIFC